uniref:lysozyme n=1 Tax=Salvator merianae TaxID=96440 RepID=A0A8D0BHX7_SALMN
YGGIATDTGFGTARQRSKIYSAFLITFLLGLCLVLFSSSFDTAHYEYTNGNPYYGLFHFSGLKWCDNGRHPTQNICKIDCDEFLDDDITDDIECAKIVSRSKAGMLSW